MSDRISMFLTASMILFCACGDAVTPSDIVEDTLPPADATGDTDAPVDFVVRTPAAEALECQMEFGGAYWIGQIDHICRIENTALTADLYIQADPIDCGQWGNPSYETPHGWLKIDGTVTEVPVGYDFGGRHNNDIISFTWQGRKHLLYHSSIGYGWRACTTPDCMIVCEAGKECAPDDGTDVETDGCARVAGDPPPDLQVICVIVNADGSVPEFEDPWTTLSPYGENGEMILPCLGEESVML